MSDDKGYLEMISGISLAAMVVVDFGDDPAFQEGIASEAARHGMTEAEYREALAKWVEFHRMLDEFTRAHGVEARGMFQAPALEMVVETIRAARSSGGEATAHIKKQLLAEAAQNAARLWDGLATIPEHNRVAVIAKRMGISEPTARKYLRETGRKTKRR